MNSVNLASTSVPAGTSGPALAASAAHAASTRGETAQAQVARLQSELRRAQAQNRELSARIEHLEAFATSASHDLKGPLRIIHGFGDALLEDYAAGLDSSAANYVRRMLGATERLEDLVQALLQLGRIPRCRIEAEPLDLAALARDILSELRLGCPEREVELVLPPRLLAHGDPVLVRIALTNLLSNAWKFSARRPVARIELGQRLDNGSRAIFVRDNGVGFDNAHAQRIFRPFERLHAARDFEGSGVGLATVRRIIEMHGGRAWADGSEGGGATFYFTLPRA